jgi:hypothetical protein
MSAQPFGSFTARSKKYELSVIFGGFFILERGEEVYCTTETAHWQDSSTGHTLLLIKFQGPPLKGQCHEIFDVWFFHQTITLKYFRTLFRIR